MSLTKKVIISVILIFLISLAEFSIGSFWIERKIYPKYLISNLTTLNKSAIKHFELFMNNLKIRVADWSSDGKIRQKTEEIIRTESSESALELSSYLKTQKLPLEQFVILTTIHSPEGKIIASSDPEIIGLVAEKDLVLEASKLEFGKAIIGDIEYKPEHKIEKLMIHAAAPLYSPNGEAVGVIINHIDRKSLDEIFRVEPVNSRYFLEMYLINEAGLMLTSSKYLGIDAVLKQKVSIPDLDKYFKANEKLAGEWTNYINKKVFGVINQIPMYQKYALVSEITKESALTEILVIRNKLFIFFLVFFTISIILALIIIRRKINEIENNLKALISIGEGDFETRTIVQSKDEIGQIGEHINKTAQKLQDYFEKIKKLQRNYTLLINSAPLCIKWFDKNGKLLFINKYGMEEHRLKSQEEALKWDYLNSIDSEFQKMVKQNLNKALAGESCQIEFKHTPEGSTHTWCQSWLRPLKDEQGKTLGVLFISADLTKDKEMEEKTKELDELKNKFITIVSHQMRTPLNEIRWSLETILEGTLGKITKDQENMLKNSYDADTEIIHRIDDLITTLNIEEQKLRLEIEEAYLETLVSSLLIEFDKQIKDKKLKIIFKEPKEKIKLYIDPLKISHAIAKLLDNAIKYTREGGEITIKIDKEGEEIFFTISDNGIGIPTDDQDKLFTKFYRATNAFTMHPDASGLGLFIAKAIIEAHNGKIWFNSQEGRGSDFYFKLPIKSSKI